jgi:hypothetical protein
MAANKCRFRTFVLHLQQDMEAELRRRRASPGGQQAGTPHYCTVPLSIVKEFERDCRHLLEAKDDEG